MCINISFFMFYKNKDHQANKQAKQRNEHPNRKAWCGISEFDRMCPFFQV